MRNLLVGLSPLPPTSLPPETYRVEEPEDMVTLPNQHPLSALHVLTHINLA